MERFPPKPEVDLEPLGHAVARLREAVDDYQEDPKNLKTLDSLIKRFELVFELSRSAMIRVLRLTSNKWKVASDPSFNYVIRTANQDGLLLGTVEEWLNYRDARNRTVHQYSEEDARTIAETVPAFL